MINKKIIEFQDMVYQRLHSLTEGVSNCIGTALYLVGELDHDRYIWKGRNHRLFRMTPLLEPIPGAIASWNNYKTLSKHMAVVTSVNPLRLVQRYECKGKIEIDISINNIDLVFLKELGDNRTFHLPKKLEVALKR